MDRTWIAIRLRLATSLLVVSAACTDGSGVPLLSPDGPPPSPSETSPPTFGTTESTGAAILVRDGFTRVISNGWGEADNGGPWRIGKSTRADFRVLSGKGQIVAPDNKPRNAVATDGYGLDVAGLASFGIDTPPDRTNRYYTIQVYARRDDRESDGDNYYRFRVRAYGKGTMDVTVEKNVRGVLTSLTGNVPIAATFKPGQKYWIRWACVGVSPATTLRLRVWADGTAEPTAWALAFTHNEPALDVIGTTGFRASGPNGTEQTTWPVTFSFDDLEYVEWAAS
jgi:hypothetical protein